MEKSKILWLNVEKKLWFDVAHKSWIKSISKK